MKVAWGGPLSTGPRTWLLCTPSPPLPRANDKVCLGTPGTHPGSFLQRDDPQIKWWKCGDMVRLGGKPCTCPGPQKAQWGMGRAKLGTGVGVAPPNGGQVHTDRWPHGGLGILSPK